MPGAIRLAIALLAVMLGPGCGDGPRPPALKGAPDEPRIVVLSPALGVVLHDLGLREHIVGRHGYDTVLDQSIPVCGEQNGVNYEALLRARPTHVITEWGTRELPAKLAGLAESNGWVLRDFRMLTLGDVDAAATALGGMLPQASPSARISRMHELAGAAPPDRLWSGRVLLLMDVSPIAAIGPGSAHHELLVRVGGVPAISEGSPYMPMHKEDVARLAPDAIILIRPARAGVDPDEPPGAAEARRDQLGAIASLDIPAARAGRLAIVDHPLALLPSTALADVADEFAALLGAWAEQ